MENRVSVLPESESHFPDFDDETREPSFAGLFRADVGVIFLLALAPFLLPKTLKSEFPTGSVLFASCRLDAWM